MVLNLELLNFDYLLTLINYYVKFSYNAFNFLHTYTFQLLMKN